MIQAVKGTKDILPANVQMWQFLESKFREVTKRFCYNEMRTPIFEKTEVFSRTVGDESDIVNKEMYTFIDKGDESITLRPEQTAAIARAIIQNNLLQESSILKIWYFGSYFRYERPQKGRLREFHQFGTECIGSPSPEADAENIMLACELIKEIGINDYKLLINSIGNDNDRNVYKEKLVSYLSTNRLDLSVDSANRLDKNPLRILDSKDPKDIALLDNAPNILDCLEDSSIQHFEKVLEYLRGLGINYEINQRLVRGLDYYSDTVFEFQSGELGSQNSFGGGGRYNTLFSQLGGKSIPAVGFAMGVERLLIILDSLNRTIEQQNPDYYIVVASPEYRNYAFKVAETMRKANHSVFIDLSGKSFKSQFKDANKHKAANTIIIGEDEFNNQTVSVKNMETGEQTCLKICELA